MKVYNRLTDWDKIVAIATILCFIFWVLAKIPIMWDFVLFGVVYEMGVFPMILLAVLCTFYFLVRLIINRFTLNKIYLYCFLLAILTLIIIRFVFSISLDGITQIPH